MTQKDARIIAVITLAAIIALGLAIGLVKTGAWLSYNYLYKPLVIETIHQVLDARQTPGDAQ